MLFVKKPNPASSGKTAFQAAAEKAVKNGEIEVVKVWQAMLLLQDYGIVKYRDMREFDDEVREIRKNRA